MSYFLWPRISNGLDNDGKLNMRVKKNKEYEFVASHHMMMNVMQLTLVFQKKDLVCSEIYPAVIVCVDDLRKYRYPDRKTFLQKFEYELGTENEEAATNLDSSGG